tara:strand:+ start:286 stop:750 length:465 start_codon:yes stop_codon:yes gene_type:complete
MSTLKCNRIENTSTASGGLDVDTSGKVRVTTLADSSGNNNSTPAEIASGRAKAWVNFNGTGTVAIRASYNVSSITDNSTGDYTITFTNAMADGNFAVAGSARYGDNTANQMRVVSINSADTLANAMATSSVRVNINYSNSNDEDVQVVTVIIFR